MKQIRKIQSVLLFVCVVLTASMLTPITLSLQSTNLDALEGSTYHLKNSGIERKIEMIIRFKGVDDEYEKPNEIIYRNWEWKREVSSIGFIFLYKDIKWGGECRQEFRLRAHVLSNGDIQITGVLRLFEGDKEDNNDLEQEKGVIINIPRSSAQTFNYIKLENNEWFGGDYTETRIYCRNVPILPPLSVQITNPKNLATVNGKFTIRASFNRVVDKRYIYIDDNYENSQYTASRFYSYIWDTTKVSYGWHWIEVKGLDAQGNWCSKRIQVLVDNREPIEIVDDIIDYIHEKISDKKVRDPIEKKLKELKKELLKPTIKLEKVEKSIEKVKKETTKANDKKLIPNYVMNNIFRELQKIRDRIL